MARFTRNDDLTWVAVEVNAMSDKAIQVHHGLGTAWVPISQISDTYTADLTLQTQEIEIPEWLAYKKGMI